VLRYASCWLNRTSWTGLFNSCCASSCSSSSRLSASCRVNSNPSRCLMAQFWWRAGAHINKKAHRQCYTWRKTTCFLDASSSTWRGQRWWLLVLYQSLAVSTWWRTASMMRGWQTRSARVDSSTNYAIKMGTANRDASWKSGSTHLTLGSGYHTIGRRALSVARYARWKLSCMASFYSLTLLVSCKVRELFCLYSASLHRIPRSIL